MFCLVFGEWRGGMDDGLLCEHLRVHNSGSLFVNMDIWLPFIGMLQFFPGFS